MHALTPGPPDKGSKSLRISLLEKIRTQARRLPPSEIAAFLIAHDKGLALHGMNQHQSGRSIKLPLLAVVTYFLLTGSSAYADDAKIYPGEMCKPTESGAELTHYWGRVKNNTNSTMSLQCPVIRDETNYSTSYGTIWVLDQHYDVNLICTMGMIVPTTDETSMVSGFFSSRSTASLGTAQSSTPLALSNFSSLVHVNNGHLMIACDLPPVNGEGHSSGVVSYRVSENN